MTNDQNEPRKQGSRPKATEPTGSTTQTCTCLEQSSGQLLQQHHLGLYLQFLQESMR